MERDTVLAKGIDYRVGFGRSGLSLRDKRGSKAKLDAVCMLTEIDQNSYVKSTAMTMGLSCQQ